MHTVNEFNDIGRELENLLYLKSAPIAIKLLRSRDEVPDGCYIPSRDRNERPALCQAFTQVRRNRRSMAMFREDHWCLWPIISFRLGEMTEEDYDYVGSSFFVRGTEASRRFFRKNFPLIKEGQDIPGLALAPLASCTFEPDIIVVYCVPDQLRQLMMAVKYCTAEIVQPSFDTVGSCVNSVVPIINGDKPYNLCIPDPGEFERALTSENEMIFTLRADRVDELLDGIHTINDMGFGYKQLSMDLNLEYPRAEFYNVMFKKWGLKTGDEWHFDR